jgi:hypothetical protein
MEISILWWNTSLSPSGKPDRATAEHSDLAYTFTGALAQDLSLDLIALGEVSTTDAAALRSKFELAEFTVFDAALSAGRANFDLCVVYRSSKLALVSEQQLVVLRDKRKLKLGHRFDFAVAGYDKTLHVIVSHWPSRLWAEQDHPDRALLAIRLRDVIDEIFSVDSDANIVLAGDYNDEPFDLSLSDHLRATRDKRFAQARGSLLYNPFWRHLTTATGGESGLNRPIRVHAGSYFHRGGDLTRWRTFDQIIVSSSFLGAGDWDIDDERTKVVDVPTYTEVVVRSDNRFDHLPVMTVFRRKQQ